jgi:tetratricopeptide (TPR) repeat protein
VTAPSPREHLARFAAHYAAGEFTDALAAVDELIAAMPGEASLLFQRARALQALERHEEARAVVKEVVAQKPGHAAAWTLRAEVGEPEGTDYDPEPDLRRAIALDPKMPRARYVLAMVLREKDKEEESRTQLDTSIELDPRLHEAIAFRAGCLRADAWADPEADEKAGIEIVSTVHGFKFRKPDLEQALADLDRATALKGVPQYKYQRADVLHALGRYDEAAAAFQALFDELPPGHALREPAMLGKKRTEGGGAGERDEIASLLEQSLATFSEKEKENLSYDQAAAMMKSAAHGIRQGKSVTESVQSFVSDSPEDMAAVSIAWQIRQMAEEPVPDYVPAEAKGFPGHQRAWAKTCDRKLARLGFEKLGDYDPVHLQASLARKQMLSLYTRGDGRIVAAAFSVRPKWPGFIAWAILTVTRKFRTAQVVEFETAFTDDTVISTSNAGGANPYEQGPHFLAEKLPAGTKPEQLLAIHERRVSEYLASHPRAVPRELRTLHEVSEQQAMQTAAKNAYRRSIGYVSEQELRSLMGDQYDEYAPRVREKLRLMAAEVG